MKKIAWRNCRKIFLKAIFLIWENFLQSFYTKISSSFYVISLAYKRPIVFQPIIIQNNDVSFTLVLQFNGTALSQYIAIYINNV